MIKDLAMFVQSLSEKSHEIIVYIDSNEAFIPWKRGTEKFLELIDLVGNNLTT